MIRRLQPGGGRLFEINLNFHESYINIGGLVNLREKLSPGPGFETESPGLRAGALTE